MRFLSTELKIILIPSANLKMAALENDKNRTLWDSDFNNGICEKDVILPLFGNDHKRYKKFVLDNADYQKTLEYCKYSSKW